MSFELRHLRCFVVVAEELHFGRAAGRLHLSQPAVSRLIADLERRVGLPLFERSTREVRLTHQGVALLAGARETLRAADDLLLSARDARDGERGRFVVALHDEGAAELTGPVLEAFAARHPGVEIAVRSPDYTQLPTVLDRGDADVVLSGGSWGAAYATVSLFREGRGLLVGPRSPFYDAEAVVVAEAITASFAATDDPVTNAFFGAYTFADHGGGPRREHLVSDASGILHRVGTTAAATAASASTPRYWPLDGLKFVPVHDADPISVTAAVPRNSTTRLQRSFLAVAESTGRELAQRLVPTSIPPADS